MYYYIIFFVLLFTSQTYNSNTTNSSATNASSGVNTQTVYYRYTSLVALTQDATKNNISNLKNYSATNPASNTNNQDTVPSLEEGDKHAIQNPTALHKFLLLCLQTNQTTLKKMERETNPSRQSCNSSVASTIIPSLEDHFEYINKEEYLRKKQPCVQESEESSESGELLPSQELVNKKPSKESQELWGSESDSQSEELNNNPDQKI